MPATVNSIVSSVITELSQIPGVSTQTYAAPRIQQYVQDAYLLALEEMWWPNLMVWNTVTINGISGAMTTDMVTSLLNHNVDRFEDIEAVYLTNSSQRLRILPPRVNPFSISGSSSLYIVPSSAVLHRPFTIVPLTSSDELVVHSRSHPNLPISGIEYVYIDQLLLTYMAAYMYLEDDATAPGQIAKFRGLAEKRMTQAKAAWANHAIPLDTRSVNGVNDWTENG